MKDDRAEPIYLDNNATTKPAPEVVAVMLRALTTDWANPSSTHSAGQSAARAISRARGQVAGFLGVSPDRVVFTSGATEANEAVLRQHASQGGKLLTSAGEHPSVDGFFQQHLPEHVSVIPIDTAGRWRLDVLDTLLRQFATPTMVAFSLANGETGVLQDLHAIRTIAERHGASCLVDASQAVGKIALDLDVLGTSCLTFSGHKMHAPKGTGVLVQGAGAFATTIAVGGGQEGGLRGGTENVPGIVGLGLACELRKRKLGEAINHMSQRRNQFEAIVTEAIPEVLVNGRTARRVPNTSNMTFPGIDGMALVARLEARGVLCSQVSACSSGSPEPSRTLQAMGLSQERAFASLRIAVSVETSKRDIEAAAQIVTEEAKSLQQLMGFLA